MPVSHTFTFDPTGGMDLAALRAVEPPPPPDGFTDFWRGRYRGAASVDPRPALAHSAIRHPDWHVFDISYLSTGDFRIGGWLLLPRRGEVRRGLVVGHGYGGRDQPDLDVPVENTAVLFPCCRGISRSARPPISTDPDWHVLHDIHRRDAYIIGGCVEDIWVAVSVLTGLYPWTDGRIGYSGVSFGGGVGALAIAQDLRIDRGCLSLPTFGHQPLRLSLPSTGSARSVQAFAKRHANVLETLRFFDAATAATQTSQPMLAAVALFDPSVAPPCQFAVANALSKKGNEIVILDAGHYDYPRRVEQESALRERARAFFKAT